MHCNKCGDSHSGTSHYLLFQKLFAVLIIGCALIFFLIFFQSLHTNCRAVVNKIFVSPLPENDLELRNVAEQFGVCPVADSSTTILHNSHLIVVEAKYASPLLDVNCIVLCPPSTKEESFLHELEGPLSKTFHS
jgi:hypothetical protein